MDAYEMARESQQIAQAMIDNTHGAKRRAALADPGRDASRENSETAKASWGTGSTAARSPRK